MKIQNVNDTSFKKYGKILKGCPTDKILKEMQRHTITRRCDLCAIC